LHTCIALCAGELSARLYCSMSQVPKAEALICVVAPAGELAALQQRCTEAEQQAAKAEAAASDTLRQLEASRQRVHALQRQVRSKPAPTYDFPVAALC
jgi:hypothetical protein